MAPNARAQTAEEASRAAWNAHVVNVLGNAGIPGDINKIIAQPKPGWDKASGEAAINVGGAPRRLNYGYGTEIVGSGSGSRGQFNSFTGVGSGAAPAGASGVLMKGQAPGFDTGGTPLHAASDHINDLLARAETLRARGDLSGALQAKGLEAHAKNLTALFGALAQHGYQMGSLNLEAAKSRAGIIEGNIAAEQLAAGQTEKAAVTKRAAAGSALHPTVVTPVGTYRGSADDPSSTEYMGFPKDMYGIQNYGLR